MASPRSSAVVCGQQGALDTVICVSINWAHPRVSECSIRDDIAGVGGAPVIAREKPKYCAARHAGEALRRNQQPRPSFLERLRDAESAEEKKKRRDPLRGDWGSISLSVRSPLELHAFWSETICLPAEGVSAPYAHRTTCTNPPSSSALPLGPIRVSGDTAGPPYRRAQRQTHG